MAKVAVVGVGRIGAPVVANLVGAGYEVRVFDVRDEAVERAVSVGAVGATSALAAASRVDSLITVLPGSHELAALMTDEGDGLLAALDQSVTWIDMTSASPALGVRLAAQARTHGINYLDSPVGGGPAAARTGSLTLYVGGAPDVLAARLGLLHAVATPDRVHPLGPSGSGYVAKLLINLLWFGQAAATAEALLLGQSFGLAPAALQRLIGAGPAASAFNEDYVPRLLQGDYVRDFGLDRCVEELRSMTAFAEAQGMPFDVSSAVARLYEDALRRFGAVDGELLAVAELEARAGRRLRAD